MRFALTMSNPCTSLERAVAFLSVRTNVTTLLLLFGMARPAFILGARMRSAYRMNAQLPFGGLWYLKSVTQSGTPEHYSRSHDVVISRVTKSSGFLAFSAFLYSFSGF